MWLTRPIPLRTKRLTPAIRAHIWLLRYTDSFTNEMHERTTIQEWVDETVREVLARKPQAVIEMGCGKGMILFKVAAHKAVQKYVGCDLSRLAVEHVERVWKRHRDKDGVECHLSTFVRDASNFAGLPDGSFDAVVCNGVSMYFPSTAYLVETLRSGLPKLKPAGCYHFGDVISKAHYALFLLRRSRHFDSTFEQLQQTDFRAALYASAKDRCFESDLFYALHLNGQLPGVAAVEVQLKHGAIMSEFSRYRYNVLLHLGKAPAAPLALLSVPTTETSARKTAEAVGEALRQLARQSPDAVVACHAIPNARLSADWLLASGTADDPAPATQCGVGEGGGVDPAELRTILTAVLPGYYVVVQWARDGSPNLMDAYAFPVLSAGTAYPISEDSPPPTTAMLAPGLLAIARSAIAPIGELALVERAATHLESFTNQLQSIDQSAGGKEMRNDEAAIVEAKKLWNENHDATSKHKAVLMLLAAKLSLPCITDPSSSFSAAGGNSFLAMQTIGAVRSQFGISVPVFDLLTKSFADFANAVILKANQGSVMLESWVHQIDHSSKWVPQEAPTFVFFPQAGSSPKQFASLYQELTHHCPTCRYLFIQPPGRDARVDEGNETSVSKYVSHVTTALTEYLVGPQSKKGATIFVGDSWGAIAAFAVAHELYETLDWAPTHVVVSSNASPEVVSAHRGLGSYSSKEMAELSDAELIAFLLTSGVEETNEAEMNILVDAFRADCQLYEEYVRPNHRRRLPSQLCVMRGSDDRVVTARETTGWLEEFDCEEVKFVTIPKATHHAYEEQPEAVASAFIKFAELDVPLGRSELAKVAIKLPLSPDYCPSAKGKDCIQLAPPCTFVRGVDPGALQAYREGNLMYRMGSPYGSKGELENLPSVDDSLPYAPIRLSNDWPSRTASPF